MIAESLKVIKFGMRPATKSVKQERSSQCTKCALTKSYSLLPPSQILVMLFLCISVQFSSVHSVMSDSLRLHESQHTRPPCPSPTPGVHPNSCASSQWCQPTISSSVIPFSSCPQSLPASECFPMIQLFSWGGHSIEVSASASVLPMNTQDWSPLGWTDWISLQSKIPFQIIMSVLSPPLLNSSSCVIHLCVGPRRKYSSCLFLK